MANPRRSRAIVREKHADRAKMWRMVEGSIVDTFKAHPEYLTERGAYCAVESLTKRIVGTLAGAAKEVREDGRASGSWPGGDALTSPALPGGEWYSRPEQEG